MWAAKVRSARVVVNRILPILAFCLLLVSAPASAQHVPVTESCDLRVGETFSSSHANFLIKFVEVTEGRCAAGLTCMWQGVAEVKLAVTADGRSQITTLFTKSGHANLPSIRTIYGRTVNLVKLEPYPRTDTPFDAGTYVLALSISDSQ